MRKPRFVIALSDSHDHLHMICTDIESDKDLRMLKNKMKKWAPKPTRDSPHPDERPYLSSEEVYKSLKELTGHDFRPFKPDYCRGYGYIPIYLENTYGWDYD